MNWKSITELFPEKNLDELLIWVHFGNPSKGISYKGYFIDGKLGGFPSEGVPTHYCEILPPRRISISQRPSVKTDCLRTAHKLK